MAATSLSLINQTYLSSSLSTGSTSKDATASSSNSTKTNASTSALTSTSTSSSTQTSGKVALARQQLNKLQLGLAQDLRAALTKAGAHLSGTVDFNVGANGKLTLTGSEADKAKVQAVLAADKSVPSLSSRLTALDKQAESFDRQNLQSIAISTAIRTGGKSAQNVLAKYQSLMSQQPSSAAVFSLSDKTSQLAFNGAVDTKA